MEEIFGLPAHPFMIHFPTVAIPLLAILGIVFVVRPSLRPSWRHAMAVFTIVTVISTIFAAGSGEALADAIEAGDYIDTHRSLGEQLRIIAILHGLSLLALLYLVKPDARASENSSVKAIDAVTSLAVVALSIMALIWVIRTGHEGTKVHWEGFI